MSYREILNIYMRSRKTGYTSHMIQTAPYDATIIASNQTHKANLEKLIKKLRPDSDIKVILPHKNSLHTVDVGIVLLDNYTIEQAFLKHERYVNELEAINITQKNQIARLETEIQRLKKKSLLGKIFNKK